MKKLIAIFAFSYVNGNGNKVHVYILDGTEEQHKLYLDRVDAQFQPEGGYDDRNNKHPELKGNPAFFSSSFKGDIVEITIPEDKDKKPRINMDSLEKELEEATVLGASFADKKGIMKQYEQSLVKYRASKKATEPAAEGTDKVDGLN